MRIIIADRDSSFIKDLREFLIPAGNQVVGEATDGITALKLTRTMQPDLVLLDANLPGMDGLEVGKIIEESRLAPVIIFASYSEKQCITEGGYWSFPVMPKPLDVNALAAVIDYVINSHKKVVALEKEVRKLRSNLAVRKMVEKAKGILMKKQGLSEEEAYRKMQQLSMKKRTSMRKIAEIVILANDI